MNNCELMKTYPTKICALRLDVLASYSQLLCLRIETCGFAFFKGVAT